MTGVFANNEHFAYLKQAAKSNFEAVVLNERLSKYHLFNTNAEFITLFNSAGVHETKTSLLLQFSSDIFTTISFL
jgi:hypothetical protein